MRNKTIVPVIALVVAAIAAPVVASAQLQVQSQAQPQSQDSTNNTLEIPIIAQAGQPPLDEGFVGTWCGTMALTSTQHEAFSKDAPSVAPPAQTIQRCRRFVRRSGGGIVLVDPQLINIGVLNTATAEDVAGMQILSRDAQPSPRMKLRSRSLSISR